MQVFRMLVSLLKIISKHQKTLEVGCLLDYPFLKENYKLTTIDSKKQQAPDADPKATQQVNFTENLV